MALLLKLVLSSCRIWHLVLLQVFVVYVPRKNFLNKGCEYGCLSRATIPEFLKLFLRVVFICAGKKEGRFWGEAVTGYLTRGSNKVKLWQQWTGFLLVDCCGWVVILGKACVEICRRSTAWESGISVWVPRGGTWWRGSPRWNRMVHLSSLIPCWLFWLNTGVWREHLTSQLSWVAVWLLVTRVCSVYLPSRWVIPCALCSLMIGLMVVVLRFLPHVENGFSSVGTCCHSREWVRNSRTNIWSYHLKDVFLRKLKSS